MSKQNQRRLAALQAMAEQSVSPEEAKIAQEKLNQLAAQPADEEEVHAYGYGLTVFRSHLDQAYNMLGMECRHCRKPVNDPVHDVYAPERKRRAAEAAAARLADEEERKAILRRFEQGTFKGVTIKAGGSGVKIDYGRQSKKRK